MSAGEQLAPIYAFSDPKRITGRYIVRFKDQVNDSKAAGEARVAQRGGRIYQHLSGLKAFWGELPDSTVLALRPDPTVAYIEADVAVPPPLRETLRRMAHPGGWTV